MQNLIQISHKVVGQTYSHSDYSADQRVVQFLNSGFVKTGCIPREDSNQTNGMSRLPRIFAGYKVKLPVLSPGGQTIYNTGLNIANPVISY